MTRRPEGLLVRMMWNGSCRNRSICECCSSYCYNFIIVLLTMKGVGMIIVVGSIAEIVDTGGFANPKQIPKLVIELEMIEFSSLINENYVYNLAIHCANS